MPYLKNFHIKYYLVCFDRAFHWLLHLQVKIMSYILTIKSVCPPASQNAFWLQGAIENLKASNQIARLYKIKPFTLLLYFLSWWRLQNLYWGRKPQRREMRLFINILFQNIQIDDVVLRCIFWCIIWISKKWHFVQNW